MRPSASRVRTGRRRTAAPLLCSATLSLERLYSPGGIVSLAAHESSLVYRLPTNRGLPNPAPAGRTEIVLSPIRLLVRIARLIPPPGVHRHRYHSVLAANAKFRAAVTRIGRPEAETLATQRPNPKGRSQHSLDAEPTRPGDPARIPRAALPARI